MSDSSTGEDSLCVLAQAQENYAPGALDAWAHVDEEFNDEDSFSSLNLNKGSKLEDIYQCLGASGGHSYQMSCPSIAPLLTNLAHVLAPILLPYIFN